MCRLIAALPASPVLTTSTAADLIGRSFQATSKAIDRLLGAGVLTQVNVGRRNRVFESPELIEAFTALERQLASPEGDMRVSPPAAAPVRTPGSRYHPGPNLEQSRPLFNDKGYP